METDPTSQMPFMKMHGLGNDFVVLDQRGQAPAVSERLVAGLADRHRGVGFDQLAAISDGAEDAHLTFYNADGSMSAACGNATRCVARYLMDETGRDAVRLTTDRGVLEAVDAGGGLVSVNMGAPQLDWRDIPLSHDMDIDALPIDGAPMATGMGNPHCTFFVENAEAEDLQAYGQRYETHEFFPERTNVQVVSLTGPNSLRVRVWERGVGHTLASGSSSCAVAVAAARRGLTDRQVTLHLDGGALSVHWTDIGVWMTGPTMHVFSGTLTPAFLEAWS